MHDTILPTRGVGRAHVETIAAQELTAQIRWHGRQGWQHGLARHPVAPATAHAEQSQRDQGQTDENEKSTRHAVINSASAPLSTVVRPRNSVATTLAGRVRPANGVLRDSDASRAR